MVGIKNSIWIEYNTKMHLSNQEEKSISIIFFGFKSIGYFPQKKFLKINLKKSKKVSMKRYKKV